ncbi:uncharacterized protein [Onthophagus taurus]|uniref:uncharacterized protein n=1 Tax=Onthophagus taurus TaxID=166361 RepID=UPI0039BEB591
MELRESLEIRKLSPKYRSKLVSILQNQDDWKMLMSNIPELLGKDHYHCSLGEHNLPRYNSDHIRIIEQASKDSNRAPTDVLFEEWGSSGRIRPTLGHLFHLVQTLEMRQATEYIASLLNKNITRRPTIGPSAPVVLNTEELRIIESDSITSEIQNLQYPSFSIENATPYENKSVNIPDLSNLMRISSHNEPQTLQNGSDVVSTSTEDNNSTSIDQMYLPDFDRINTKDESVIIPNQEYVNLKSLCLEGTIMDPFPGVRRDRSDSAPGKSLSLNTPLRHFNYHDLKEATNNFDKTPSTVKLENGDIGRFLGSGGYGSVYLALGLKEEPTAAVKKITLDGQMINLQDHILNSFKTEVENLYKFKHDNLVGLLGYSCDGPSICLVYEYIPGGNLNNRLNANNVDELGWKTRIEIAFGISKAVCYLHIANPKQPFIHRDIKTANILLDAQKKPKLCDFGTARLSKHTTSHTVNVIGTGPYMSPEGTRGDVSVKLDTFSFGVVLLELLTGWPPLDHSRSSYDLLTFVRELLKDNNENVSEILDKKAGDWTHKNINFGLELYKICKKCVEDLKADRPFMMNVKDQLEILVDLLNDKQIILPHISFESLIKSTNNFNESNLIFQEESEFNSLEYLCRGFFGSETNVVKKITIDGHSPIYHDFHLYSFKEEIEKICQFKHLNLVELLGYCCEYPYYCFIYEHMDADNLQNKLRDERNNLSCANRLKIAVQISRAIAYLHNFSHIHRDLRSVNVYLDQKNIIKIRTGKLFKNSSTNSVSISRIDPYMSPEGIRGDISVKLDSFSFGIILLELLTGLEPFDPERSSFDLLTYVSEEILNGSFKSILDKKVDSWSLNDINIDEELFKMSELCVKEKPHRPFMIDVNTKLEELLSSVEPEEDFRPALSFLMN